MKKLFLVFSLLTSVLLAQPNANFYDNGKTYYPLFSLGVEALTGNLAWFNQKGEKISALNLNNYFTSKQDFNQLQNIVNDISLSYLSKTPFSNTPGFIPYYLEGMEAPQGVSGYYTASIDYLLGRYSTIIANQQMLIDTLLARDGWRHATAPVTYYPHYAFYYDPINMGTNITSDTIITKYITNTKADSATAIMLVSYSNSNAWISVWDSSGGRVPKNDSIKVYFKWIRSGAITNVSYNGNVYVNHNGGGSTGISTTDTISVSGKWIQTGASPEKINIYVNNECTTCIEGRSGDTVYTIQTAINESAPGDVIAIKRGQTFNENVIINKDSITITTYGSGTKPIIQNYDSIPNWWNTGSWQSRGNNIWTLFLANIIAPNSRLQRLWINGSEVNIADLCYSSYAQSQWLGTNYPFYHNNNYLYIYSATNPATAFSSMRYYGKQNTPYTVEISADSVTLDSLDIRGGTFASVGLLGADKTTIQNCDIGKYSVGGVHAHAAWEYNVDDKTSDSVVIKKCTIDSYSNDKSLSDCSSGGKQGIYIGASDNNFNSGSYWLVDSCVIKNWWFGIYVSQDTRYNKLSRYNVISNNEIYNTDFTAGGKGIQLYSWSLTNSDTTNMSMFTKIYNNYIHDLGGSGICVGSNSNYIYYNIIDSIYMGANGHIMNYSTTDDTTDGNGGYGIEIGTEYSSQSPYETLKGNYIFNNTIYKNYMFGVGQSGSDNFIYNNLFLEPYSKPYMSFKGQSSPLVFFGNSGTAIKNNLYIRTGSGVDSYVFQLYNGASPLTTAQLNQRTNCGGNIYATQTVAQIMNSDFTLPGSSSALNGGISIESLVGSGFKDRFGNTVNRANPNIGASDN